MIDGLEQFMLSAGLEDVHQIMGTALPAEQRASEMEHAGGIPAERLHTRR